MEFYCQNSREHPGQKPVLVDKNQIQCDQCHQLLNWFDAGKIVAKLPSVSNNYKLAIPVYTLDLGEGVKVIG